MTSEVWRWWLQSVCGEASQLSADVASDFGFWHQINAVATVCINLTDTRHLSYFNLLLPACQNDNVICSPVFLLQKLCHDTSSTVWLCECVRLCPSYMSWHIFYCLPAAEQHQVLKGRAPGLEWQIIQLILHTAPPSLHERMKWVHFLSWSLQCFTVTPKKTRA